MLGAHFRDPMQVPYVFADDNEEARRFAGEWGLADLLATDTETDYDPDLNLSVEVAEPRVVSAFAAFKDTTGVVDDALITGDDLPAFLTERGYVAAKSYVIDTGYVDGDIIGQGFAAYETAQAAKLAAGGSDPDFPTDGVYVWNGKFERKVFERLGFRVDLLDDLMLYQAALDQGAEGVRWYMGLARAAEHYLDWNLEGKGGIQLSYRPVSVLPTLSDEQKAYAAQDAVATGLLAPIIVGACKAVTVVFDGVERSLADTGRLESRAQPFLDKMTVAGTPIVVDGAEVHVKVKVDGKVSVRVFSGWTEYVGYRRELMARCEIELSEMISERSKEHGELAAQQGMFNFDDPEEEAVFKTTVNPGSQDEVKELLNRIEPDRVRAYTVNVLGSKSPRLLAGYDSIDKSALELIGGPLAAKLREWGQHSKLVSDSGEKFLRDWADPQGRLHPEIKQCLVATGRLAMEKPAMQNRPPELKLFHRASPGKAICYADLSQAELRTLAHMSGDERMSEAFRTGQDLHTVTAAGMFDLDMDRMLAPGELDDRELVALALANRVKIPVGSTDPDTDHVEADGSDRLIDVDGGQVARSQLIAAIAKSAKLNRSKAKVPNFGIPYNMGPGLLAKTLTLNGVPTTSHEGKDIITRWMATYPQVGEWLSDRDQFIQDLAANPPECDFEATWRLIRNHKRITDIKWDLKRQLDRFPTNVEIGEALEPDDQLRRGLSTKLGRTASDEEVAAERQAITAFVKWVLSFAVPVVVQADGTPVAFASRTLGGRRRLFQIAASLWLESQALVCITSKEDWLARAREEFGQKVGKQLHSEDGSPFGWARARKALPKNLHQRFVEFVLGSLPEHQRGKGMQELARRALSDRIRAMGGQFRNAPIQGTVGDVALLAYALLEERLRDEVPSAVGVLTVHDSVMLECDLADARKVAAVLQQSMEEALAFYCPSIPPKADAAILYSFDEADVIPDDVLDAAEAAAGLTAAA